MERENHFWGESKLCLVGLTFNPNPSANFASVERKKAIDFYSGCTFKFRRYGVISVAFFDVRCYRFVPKSDRCNLHCKQQSQVWVNKLDSTIKSTNMEVIE